MLSSLPREPLQRFSFERFGRQPCGCTAPLGPLAFSPGLPRSLHVFGRMRGARRRPREGQAPWSARGWAADVRAPTLGAKPETRTAEAPFLNGPRCTSYVANRHGSRWQVAGDPTGVAGRAFRRWRQSRKLVASLRTQRRPWWIHFGSCFAGRGVS